MDTNEKTLWQKIKWWFNLVTTIIMNSIIVILVLIGILFLAYYIDVTKNVNSGNWQPPLFGAYVIISGSMEPNIHVYDVIVSKRVDTTELKEGDVITFFSNDNRFYGVTITPRIVEVIDAEEGIFRTRGEANNVEDDALTIKENKLNGEKGKGSRQSPLISEKELRKNE